MAARIIDPATGASTWALGSHKWTENRGSFTRNAADSLSHMIGLIISIGMNIIHGMENIKVEFKLNNFIIINNRGRDAVTVYMIKYILACVRSGWYPHNMIRSIVGIREASNQM